MNDYIKEPRENERPPKGYINLHVPGTKKVWINERLATQVSNLLERNKVKEARTLILWFGGEEEKS